MLKAAAATVDRENESAENCVAQTAPRLSDQPSIFIGDSAVQRALAAMAPGEPDVVLPFDAEIPATILGAHSPRARRNRLPPRRYTSLSLSPDDNARHRPRRHHRHRLVPYLRRLRAAGRVGAVAGALPRREEGGPLLPTAGTHDRAGSQTLSVISTLCDRCMRGRRTRARLWWCVVNFVSFSGSQALRLLPRAGSFDDAGILDARRQRRRNTLVWRERRCALVCGEREDDARSCGEREDNATHSARNRALFVGRTIHQRERVRQGRRRPHEHR